MASLTAKTLDGGTAEIAAEAVEALRGVLRGEIIEPGGSDYDEVRAIWNAMIDRRPAMIVRCHGAADVMAAVRFARERSLLVSVRGAGHNIAGKALADGAVLIDLSPMKGVRVDPSTKTAIIGPGATLKDVDFETQAFGLALPIGINSTTGIAGLTLGGGFGWLTRKYGMTIDNLIGADIVIADGSLVRASESQNPELFWAIRGGGGNFGIVTAFEFRLREVGPEVMAGLVVYPFDQAESVLEKYRAATAQAPEEMTAWVVLRKAPPLPFLPEEVHGKEVVVCAMVNCGSLDAAAEQVEPFRNLGTPVGEHLGPMPLSAFQQAFDPLLTPGARNYWKTHDFAELSDGMLEILREEVAKLPTGECEIFIAHLGGAMSRVPVDATAYAGRGASYVMNVHTRWQTAAEDKTCVAWARSAFDRLKPYAMGTAYVNFMADDETDRVEEAYGANFERLAEAKRRYDPDNFFRVNQNVAAAKS